MGTHFQAFSFVDRLTRRENGQSVGGSYAIPAHLSEFPEALVGEAIGQMAAWHAMQEIGFTHRPVAGIASKVEFISEVRPGDVLDLRAELYSADEESVNYSGQALVGGREVLTLTDCLGPMLPLEEFDAPEAVRSRYELISSQGAIPGCFKGVPKFVPSVVSSQAGEFLQWDFTVPENEDFFGDHFPRKPIFPGTLLTGLFVDLASSLVNGEGDDAGFWRASGISNLKLRSFMEPGIALNLQAKVAEKQDGEILVFVETRKVGKRRVIAGGKVTLRRKDGE